MARLVEFVSIIQQAEEREITSMTQEVAVTEKNGSIFIRYKEERTDIPVLIKWNQADRIELTRRSEPVNKMLFIKGEEVDYYYPTPAGTMVLKLVTTDISSRMNAHGELEWLEWAYQIQQEEEILGDYQVKLHFMS